MEQNVIQQAEIAEKFIEPENSENSKNYFEKSQNAQVKNEGQARVNVPKAPSYGLGKDDIKAAEIVEKAPLNGLCKDDIKAAENSEKATLYDLGKDDIKAAEIVEKATSSELILGKFKSVEDLSKAYVELEKHQGESSNELGMLRKNAESMENLAQKFQQISGMQGELTEYLNEYKQKYDTPEYFQNQSFKEIYREAFKLLGSSLDTDKFIDLIENYVGSRILENEKVKSAKEETQKVLSSMTYSKNPKSSITPPKKSFDEMSEKEVDELLERII